MKKVILCIDDQPDQRVGRTEFQLESVLKRIFPLEGAYELRFAETWAETEDAIVQDVGKLIKLVFLDCHLDFRIPGVAEKWHFKQVAKWLYVVRPDIRIVGFTGMGTDAEVARSFEGGDFRSWQGLKVGVGKLENKVMFIQKQGLLDPLQNQVLRNFSRAVIEDYQNERLFVQWMPESGALILRRDDWERTVHPYERKEDSGEYPKDGKGNARDNWSSRDVLTAALRVPNKWVGPFPGSVHTDAVQAVNLAVWEGTGGRSWGILTTEGAPARCVKAVVNPANRVIDYSSEVVKCPDDCLAANGVVQLLQRLEQDGHALSTEVEALRAEFQALKRAYEVDLRGCFNALLEVDLADYKEFVRSAIREEVGQRMACLPTRPVVRARSQRCKKSGR